MTLLRISTMSPSATHRATPPDDGGDALDRRDFLGRTASLAVLALLAGACGDLGSVTGPGFDQDILLTLADYPDLAPVGAAVRVSGVSTPLALVHSGEGSYLALSLVCPHAGTSVQWTGSGFRCPNHGALFTATGSWSGGHRTSALRRYPTTYDAATGTVTISPR
jgi:Rieske Fe-S protein